MYVMYDSVDLSQIPAGPHAVACYVNGRYANADEARKRFPHARILTLSVSGDTVADGYDIERGDYNPGEAGHLHQVATASGIWRPCMYADLSNMPAVKESLSAAGVNRRDVRLWVAYYNGTPDLPTGYDAHQFTETALGRNLDESVCDDGFFQAYKPAPATKMAARVEFDPDSKTWDIAPLPAVEE